MIGPLEIAIIVVLLLLIFGWRYLPSIGRKAGTGARELKEGVQEVVGDKADPKTLRVVPWARVRDLDGQPDEIRLLVQPKPCPAGMVALEIGFEWLRHRRRATGSLGGGPSQEG